MYMIMLISTSMSMKKTRNLVIATLVAGGLNKPSAENYEKAIYNAYPMEDEYISIAYDKIGQLRTAKDRTERESILKDIRKGNAEWESCVYAQQKERYQHAIDHSRVKTKPS